MLTEEQKKMGPERKGGCAARFHARVDKSAGPDGCWLWTGAKNADGYGSFRFREGDVAFSELAHRAALRLDGQLLPAGMYVCHRCDVPACVNPSHLYVGSPLENTMDRVRRGRCGGGAARGSKNGQARLTEAQVAAIKSSALSQSALGRMHGVSQSTIHNIRTGKKWRHV